MPQLNDNQKYHLLMTFQHVDNLLDNALRTLVAADIPSPFQQYIPDAQPSQQAAIRAQVEQLRQTMVQILKNLGIALPEPQISSLWAFRTTLMSATIAIEELSPQHMRGYGDLTADAAGALETLKAEVMEVLEKMGRCLTTGND